MSRAMTRLTPLNVRSYILALRAFFDSGKKIEDSEVIFTMRELSAESDRNRVALQLPGQQHKVRTPQYCKATGRFCFVSIGRAHCPMRPKSLGFARIRTTYVQDRHAR